MPVDDVWKEPKFGRVSCVWNICRIICLFLWGVFSKLVLGGLNKCTLYNKEVIYRAVYKREPGRALITISNHRSYLDACVLPSAFAWSDLSSFAKAECTPWTPGAKNILHTTYLTSLLFTLLKGPPIVQGDGIFQRTMNFLIETLNRGSWVHIFPEGNNDNKKRMDEFEFMQNFITDYGVSCPWASEKSMNNLVTIIKWIFFSFTGIVNQKEQKLLPFKPGIGRLVSECKTYPIIVPAYVTGMREVIPMKKPYYPRIGKAGFIVAKYLHHLQTEIEHGSKTIMCIKVFIGDPIDICSDLEEMKKKDTPQQEVWQYIADKLQEKMEILAQEANDIGVSSKEAVYESPKEHSS